MDNKHCNLATRIYLFIYAFYIGASHTLQIDSMIGEYKQCMFFFSSIKGGFPQQGPRPAYDCISGPRLIPAVLWGHPAYIMRALPRVGMYSACTMYNV